MIRIYIPYHYAIFIAIFCGLIAISISVTYVITIHHNRETIVDYLADPEAVAKKIDICANADITHDTQKILSTDCLAAYMVANAMDRHNHYVKSKQRLLYNSTKRLQHYSQVEARRIDYYKTLSRQHRQDTFFTIMTKWESSDKYRELQLIERAESEIIDEMSATLASFDIFQHHQCSALHNPTWFMQCQIKTTTPIDRSKG